MMSHINKLRHLFDRHDKVLFLLLFFMMLAGAAIEVLGVGIIPLFITAVADPEKIQGLPVFEQLLPRLGITTSHELLLWGGFSLLLIFALRNGYLAFLAYAKARFIQGRFVRLVRRLFAAYMNAPYQFHLRRNSAELLRNCQQETQKIVMGVIQPALEVLLQFLFTVGLMILLLVTYPLPAIITIFVVGLTGGVFVWLLQKKAKDFGVQALDSRREFIKSIQQGLGGLKEIRVLHREPLFINRLSATTERLARAQRFQMTIQQTVPHITEFVGVLTIIGIAFLLMSAGHSIVTVSAVMAMFAAAFFRLKRSVSVLMNSAIQFKYTLVTIDPIYRDLTALRDRPWEDHGVTPERTVVPLPFHETLTVKNICHRYDKDSAYVLSDITMAIPQGSAIAIVGATGAGKSTLVDVLLGLLSAEAGSITVDGQDISANLEGWQANIGYIPQTIYLLDDTIRNNIALGLPDHRIDDQKIKDALMCAQLTTFIDTLPNRTQTVVGENGVRLSGGQRQRIGIARALYNNPEVLVLDEATSSLDFSTEQKIMADVNRLKGDRTIIMITHRLSTVKHCDHIFFLQDGKIAEQGRYNDLIDSSPVFRAFAQGTTS